MFITDNNSGQEYLNAQKNIPECSKNEGICKKNGKFYSQKWKLFSELSGSEEAATLNAENGSVEWQKPSEFQEFAHNGEMYRLVMRGSELVVSPEHRVYGKIADKSDFILSGENSANLRDLNGFSLMKISELPAKLSEYKVLVFLDAELNPAIVEKIEKVPYSGKIYDVDVPNDIILVRRGNSEPIWSGNSNGKYGNALQFDGVDDYVNAGNGASLNITNAITIEAWVKPIAVAEQAAYCKSPQNGTKVDIVLFSRVDGGFSFGFYDSSWHTVISDSNIYQAGNWYHVVGTYNRVNLILYLTS